MKNYYSVLNVRNYASLDEIKSAYRKLAKKFHPDKNNTSSEAWQKAEANFKEIQEAYATLSNHQKKQLYDAKLKANGVYTSSPNNQYKAPYEYHGNAYQYAQDFHRYNSNKAKQQHTNNKNTQPKKSKKDNTEIYQFIVSIIIAIILVYFIISYSLG